MKEHYQSYIAEKAGVWSPSSVRSESQRLNRLWESIDGDAPRLWAALQGHGAYTRLTIWTRVAAFWDWLIEHDRRSPPNPYAVWRKKNRRAFANAYVRRPCEVSYDAALANLETIEDEAIRNKCKQLLTGGLRWSESFTLTPEGYVTGKGGKVRRVYPMPISGPLARKAQYSAVLRQLKKFGLRPHKLRSIKASEVVRRGADAFALKEAFGWSNLAVAESYVKVSQDRVRELMETPHPIVQELKAEAKTASLVGKLVGWASRVAVKEKG